MPSIHDTIKEIDELYGKSMDTADNFHRFNNLLRDSWTAIREEIERLQEENEMLKLEPPVLTLNDYQRHFDAHE